MESNQDNWTHVDDFIWNQFDGDAYARMVLMFFRLPATQHAQWLRWLSGFELYATYNGKRYRVVHASRLGHVSMTLDHSRDSGGDVIAMVDALTGWGPYP